MAIRIDEYHLTKSQILNGISFAVSNCNLFLQAAEHIAKSSGRLALGLYIFAVEEYGKAVLLKNSLGTGSAHYRIPTWIFAHQHPRINGKKAHEIKCTAALSALPEECKNITNGVRLKVSSGSRTIVYRTGKGRNRQERETKRKIVSASDGMIGYLQDVTRPEILNDDVRNSCFYVDWDADHRQWLPAKEFDVDLVELRAAISSFMKSLLNFEKSKV